MTSIKFSAANQETNTLKELIGKIRDELRFRGVIHSQNDRRSYFRSQLDCLIFLSGEARHSQEFDTEGEIKKSAEEFSTQYKKVIELIMKEE